ncbi:MAG: helix-turn-helix domain-containing protein [Bacteroidia bacterium]
MLTLSALRRLVAEGEHTHLEFKRKANHPDRIARELVAFANTEGGTLLIGVDDDGGIYGTKTPEGDQFAMQKVLDELVVPRLGVKYSYIRIDERRKVLVIQVKPSRRKPHFLREEGKKVAYVRNRDMSMRASREMTQILRPYRKGVTISFGEFEQKLLQHLNNHDHTTLNEVQALLKTSRRKTADLLIKLVRAGLIRIKPTHGEDHYSLAAEAFS